MPYEEGGLLFGSSRAALEYLTRIASNDNQYRGHRDERCANFELKQRANMLLHERVARCRDELEYEALRQEWEYVNRPKYRELKWSRKQLAALQRIRDGVSYEDEQEKKRSRRWLFLKGAPGSGKSAVILEAAIWAARNGLRVLIVCPTGQLVHNFKAAMPDLDVSKTSRLIRWRES